MRDIIMSATGSAEQVGLHKKKWRDLAIGNMNVIFATFYLFLFLKLFILTC